MDLGKGKSVSGIKTARGSEGAEHLLPRRARFSPGVKHRTGRGGRDNAGYAVKRRVIKNKGQCGVPPRSGGKIKFKKRNIHEGHCEQFTASGPLPRRAINMRTKTRLFSMNAIGRAARRRSFRVVGKQP